MSGLVTHLAFAASSIPGVPRVNSDSMSKHVEVGHWLLEKVDTGLKHWQKRFAAQVVFLYVTSQRRISSIFRLWWCSHDCLVLLLHKTSLWYVVHFSVVTVVTFALPLGQNG